MVNATIYNTDPEYKGKAGIPPVATCPFCGGELRREGIKFGGAILWNPTNEPCTCEQGVAEYNRLLQEREKKREAQKLEQRRLEVERKRDECNLPRRLKNVRFEKLKRTERNERMLKIAERYAQGFEALLAKENPLKTGLYIYGGVGTGKTYTAACVANYVLDQGQSVAFTSMLKYQNELRQSYGSDDKNNTEREIINRYSRVKLLVLDDLGKEPPTTWGLSRLFELVDGRNMAQMPTIVTSNYDPESLIKRITPQDGDEMTARATIDRLVQDCYLLNVDGESFRA